MPDVELAFDPVKISIEASCRVVVQTPSLTSAEVFNHIVPIRANVVELDPYRTRLGWPVEVPRLDSHTPSLASVQGFRIAQRPEPLEIVTGAIARWIGDPDTYDTVAGVWRPSQGDEEGLRWNTSPDFSPSYIEKFPYFVGKELFTRDAINFDATNREHMWSDFTGGLIGTTGYTVVMAVILNSAYGNTPGRSFMGVWGPGGAPGVGDTFAEPETGYSLLLENSKLVVDSEAGENHEGLEVVQLLSAPRPVYIAFVMTRPVSTVYGSLGPGKTTRHDTMVGHEQFTQQMNVVLGRSTGDVLHTADMTIFDIGIYPDALTSEQVEGEIALLAASYGG